MAARDALVHTLRVLADCLSDGALVDKAPSEVAHNLRAAMLRQGLAVLAFSTMETFVRDRVGEVLGSFSNKNLKFSDLSPALQRGVTLGAFEGVRFRLKMKPPDQKVEWLAASLLPIAQVKAEVSNLSGLSFGCSSSNIAEDDIKEVLSAFGVVEPWRQITILSSRLRAAVLDAKSEFIAIKDRRHESAHTVVGSVPHADLESSLRSVRGICAAFDVLLTSAAVSINRRQQYGTSGRPHLDASRVQLLFVERRVDGSFAVKRESPTGRGVVLPRPLLRLFPDAIAARTFGLSNAENNRRTLVVLDELGMPASWHSW